MELSRDLENAIKTGDAQRVWNLLQENDVNLRAPENINLLWSAIFRDEIEIIEILIRAGADLAAPDPHEDMGWSVLHDLVRKAQEDNHASEQYERLALLALDHGADMNALDGVEDESVLEFAVSRAESVILTKELIRRGARINEENLDDVIMNVAHFENPVEVLPLLINSHIISPENRSVRAVDAIRCFLSSYSFNFNRDFNMSMFDEMLQMIGDVNQPGSNGETVLAVAARCGRLAAVTELLNRGADINKKTTEGVLPIYAASSSQNSKVTELLISRGASVNDRNDNGKYPIHGACESRSADNLHYLMSIGASLNVTDYEGRYPIHSACRYLVNEIIHSLLSIGSPIDVTDIHGNTPFSLNRNWSIRSPAVSLFVKQFALLDATTGAVSESDLSIVKDNPDLLNFFERCRSELLIASQTAVFENFNLLMLLATSTTKLSAYMRNTEFVEGIENFVQRQSAQFPIYLKQFRMALQIAQRIRDDVKYTETVLEQSFPVPLPQLVIEKIASYMLSQDVISTELKFYSLLYEQINGAELDFISNVIDVN